MIFNWIDYSPLSYGAYAFPKWADMIGWFIASASLACIPAGMIKSIYEARGNTLLQVKYPLKVSFSPQLSCIPNVEIIEKELLMQIV